MGSSLILDHAECIENHGGHKSNDSKNHWSVNYTLKCLPLCTDNQNANISRQAEGQTHVPVILEVINAWLDYLEGEIDTWADSKCSDSRWETGVLLSLPTRVTWAYRWDEICQKWHFLKMDCWPSWVPPVPYAEPPSSRFHKTLCNCVSPLGQCKWYNSGGDLQTLCITRNTKLHVWTQFGLFISPFHDYLT